MASFQEIKDLINLGIGENTRELGPHASAVETADEAIGVASAVGEAVSGVMPLAAPSDESLQGVSELVADVADRMKRIVVGGISATAACNTTLARGMSYAASLHGTAERAASELVIMAGVAESIVAKTVSLSEPAEKADGHYRKATEGSSRYGDLTSSSAAHVGAVVSFGVGLASEATEKIDEARANVAQAMSDSEALRAKLADDREQIIDIASRFSQLDELIDTAKASALSRGNEGRELRGLLERIVQGVEDVRLIFNGVKTELENAPVDPKALIAKAEAARDKVG